MVNATVSPGKYLNGIYDLVKEPLLAKAKADSLAATGAEGNEPEEDPEAAVVEAEGEEKAPVDYEKYMGTYTGGLGGDETVVIPWRGGIGTMGLPSALRPGHMALGPKIRCSPQKIPGLTVKVL